MDDNELFEHVKLSSIPLRKLDKDKMPIGIASGCLTDYKQKKILLTVQHATGDNGNWAAEVKYEKNKGTQLYQLGAMNFLASFSLTDFNSKDIDFSFVAVLDGFTSYFQEIRPNGHIVSETPRRICRVSFDAEPAMTESYGFSGQVLPSRAGNILQTEHNVFMGLKYVETRDDFYVFELPMAHPGHKYFQGCSGAPIIDTQGSAVALVCKGDISTNRIFGVSLKKYQIAIDAVYGDLAGSRRDA